MRCLSFSKAIKFFCALTTVIWLQSSQANGANILGLFSSHSPSHLIVHMSVVKALAERGHNVTVVSSIKPTVTHPAIKNIIIPPTEEQEIEMEKGMQIMASTRNSLLTMLKHMLTSMSTIIHMQVDVLKDERFQRLYDQKFDLVIIGYFLNDYQLGVAAKFNCPVIVDWMTAPMAIINRLIGNPEEISYVPGMNVAPKAGEVMNFMQRMQNFISAGLLEVFAAILTYQMKGHYRELFPTDNFPTFDDMQKNVSLVFCNSHFSEGVIRPNVPAIVETGGIQIKDKPDPLPKDIAEFLDSSKQNGAILFSLGSNMKGTNIKRETIQAIFKTLSSLKQRVIWKWEDLENLPGKSPNILYKKWLPQDDILAHPNTKLFITHAGKGGIAEAQYHAVPMVALPIFADQHGNADKMVLSGYGQQCDMLSLTEPAFKAALLEVLGNQKYKDNVKQFSELYRDRPLSAMQSVVYWTEYILRHHGAKHMQSPLVHLNTVQKLSLDVIGTLLIVTFVILMILRACFRLICNKLFKKSKNFDKKSKSSSKKFKRQ